MSDVLPPVVVEIIARTKGLKTGIAEAKTEMKGFESTASGVFSGVAKVGKIGAAGLLLVGAASVKMAGDFQKETNVLVTAAGESAGSLKQVRKGILDIASSTGTTWQNLTAGMYQVEKAGFRGAGGLKVLQAAAQGAAEENANLATVTNAMTSVMASYHLGTDKSVQVMNALKTAAGGSKDTMENFAGSLSTVLPIASAAGLDFAQVGGAIAGLTRHGTSAAEATQELANTIRNLQAPNKVAVKAMEQMGVSSTALSQNLGTKGLGGTLDYLVGVIGKHMGPSGLVMIDTLKKSQSAAKDMTAMMAAMPAPVLKMAKALDGGTLSLAQFRHDTARLPIEQHSMAAQFAALETKTRGFSDALRSGSPQAQTMASQLKAMLGGSTGLNTALMLTGENTAYVSEMTKKTAASMTDSSKSVEGWTSTSHLLNIQLGMIHQSVSRVMIIAGTALIPILEKVAGFFERHTTLVKVLAGVLGGAMVVAIAAYVGQLVWSAGKAVWAFGEMVTGWFSVAEAETAAGEASTVALGPIGVAIAAIAFAAYELYKHWDQVWGAIKDVLGAAWGFIKEHFVLIMTVAFGPFGFAIAELVKHWNEVWNGVTSALGAAWNFIQTTFGAIWGFIKSHAALIVGAIFLISPPLGILIAVIHTVWKHWSTIWGAIKTVTGFVVGVVVGQVKMLVHAGLWLIRTELKILETVWKAVWGTIKFVVQTSWTVLKSVFGPIVHAGIWVIKKEIQALQAVWKAVWSVITTVVQAVWAVLKPIFDAIGGAISKVMDGIGGLKGAAGSVGGAISSVGHMLGFADGGVVPGPKGAPMMAIVHGGEFVVSNAMQAKGSIAPMSATRGGGGSGGGGGGTIIVQSDIYLDGKKIGKATATHVRDELLRTSGRNLTSIGLT